MSEENFLEEMTEETKKFVRFNRRKFLEEVEEIAGEDGSYLDAIMVVCDNNNIEAESVPFYMKGALLERVTLEAQKKFLLKKDLCSDNEAVELPI